VKRSVTLVFTSDLLKPSKHTVFCSIREICFLPKHCSYALHIPLAINIHFFLKQDWPGCHSNRGLSLFWEIWVLKLPLWCRIRLGFMGYKAVYFIRWLSESFCCLHLHVSDVVDQNIDYMPAPWLSLPCILSDYRLNAYSVSILALHPFIL
jgi:hypothetical protein